MRVLWYVRGKKKEKEKKVSSENRKIILKFLSIFDKNNCTTGL